VFAFVSNESKRVQYLSARSNGLPLDTTLYEGVPSHLAASLRSWAEDYLTSRPQLTERIALHLRIALTRTMRNATPLVYAQAPLADCDLLDAINLALQLYQGLHSELAEIDAIEQMMSSGMISSPGNASYLGADAVRRLDRILRDGESAFTVCFAPPHLVRRVDATVTGATRHTAAVADPTTAGLLRDAWRQVYGQSPDPTAGYRQAVRAVEQVACPRVLPNDSKATLGKVIGNLREHKSKWALVLVDKDGIGTIDPLVAMLDRLWSGQVSRHGGGESREQTQAEAEAAVHLACVLIQWLTTDALRKAP